jgi:hypothetical protein
MNQGNASINQNPHGMIDQGEQKDDDFYWKCSCWFFQVIDWILLSILIIVIILSSKYIVIMSLAFGIIHFIYIMVEIFSPTGKYLCHKSSGEGMYEKMGRYFRAAPKIIFHYECYHNEINSYTTTDKFGRVHQHHETIKVVTFKEDYEMPYYSERDVSGLFYLNCDEAIAKKKVYIKLKVKEEINFADSISIMDYHDEIDKIYARNRYRDVYFDFQEFREIPDLVHHNLIKLGKNEPFLSKYFFFILSSLLTLSELYKLYFDSLCIFQRFKVRKLISTRYDLNQPVYQEKYQPFIPQINLIYQSFEYKPEDYNYLNNKYEVNLPTQEELERAQRYQDKVPDYHVSSGNGQIHAGVIIDDPNFSSYKAIVNNQQPAPALFNPNNKENVSSRSVGDIQDHQVNKVDNLDTETDDSGRPCVFGKNQTDNFPLQTQIQEKADPQP